MFSTVKPSQFGRLAASAAARASAPAAGRLASTLPLSVKVSLPNGIEYEQPTGLFINNEFVPSKLGRTFATVLPLTEEEITEVYEAMEEDVDLAVDAAEAAYKNTTWATADPYVRSQALLKFADLIDANLETIASIESLDNGKALGSARGDVGLSARYIRSCAFWADKLDGRTINTGDDYMSYTRREPIGVCGQIIPWNFPLLMFAWKVGPALAAGNTVVLKTAELTPLSALFVAKLAAEAGVPPGVLNVVSGFGKHAGNAIVEHPKIRKVAFTGSTATGKRIMAGAAVNVKKVTLELGGKLPNVIFDDADLKTTIPNLLVSIFYNSGEVCCAGSRIYCQLGIYDKLLAEFKSAIAAMKVGNPFDEGTFQGAQTSQMQVDKILSYIEKGKAEGAKVVTGGERLPGKGYFIAPTVFSDVTEDMLIVQEEIFGPVVTITKFDTVDEVIEKANDSEYGLAAGLHTTDVNKALYVSGKLHAGTVWVNTYNDFHTSVPFGGFNQSGVGREMGSEAFDNYTQVKAVRIKLSPVKQ